MSAIHDPSPIVDAPSTSPRRFRRTRIAVSAVFGLLTVAMCMLWVRSYSVKDSATMRVGIYRVQLISTPNILFFSFDRVHESALTWKHFSVDAPRMYQGDPGPDWWFVTRNDGRDLGIPIWSLAAWSALAAVITIAPTRFSLRTLLIATTLFSVVLGLGVWLAR